jgi:6-phosphogluconolactonase
MAWETLLAHVPTPSENIHRIPAERPPEEAAAAYAAELERHWQGRQPVFDLILLGLGTDGHTASLFPGTDALHISDRAVAAVYLPQTDSWRITLTLPVLNAARAVLFLVSGAVKAQILADVLHGAPGRYPAQAVRPLGGLCWYVDAAAAARLPGLSA